MNNTKFRKLKFHAKQSLLSVLGVSDKVKKEKAAVPIPQLITQPMKKGHSFLSFLKTMMIAIIIAAMIRSFFVQVFYISSSAMEPTLFPKDSIIVNKLTYGVGNPFWGAYNTSRILWVLPNPLYGKIYVISKTRYITRLMKDPKRMDIVTFKSPTKGDEVMTKRIIGLPGETIKIRKGMVYINGSKLNESYIKNRDNADIGPLRIPYGSYYLIGDNRSYSIDSRSFGPVSGEQIFGIAFMKIWPPGKTGSI